MVKITAKLLTRKGVCESQLNKFIALFPDGVEPTRELCVAHANDFNFSWAAQYLLSPPARKAYSEAVWPTRKAYYDVVGPASDVYDIALALAYNVCNATCVPSYNVYEDAIAAARKVYYDAVCQAHKAYDEGIAAAFYEAWTGENQ
jgi:hypothetical protein